MAKLLSVLLVVALLCGMGAVGAGAVYIDEDGSTVAGDISMKFWKDWHPAAQWALKWLAFGWLWMQLPIWDMPWIGAT